MNSFARVHAHRMKALLTQVFGSAPLVHIGLTIHKKLPLVVLYHGVSEISVANAEPSCRRKHTPQNAFESQLKWLKRHFEIVPLKDIESIILEKSVVKKPLCAITFDDGYRNNFLTAFPILKKHDIPATIFLTTSYLNRRSPLWTDIVKESLHHTKVETISIPWQSGMKSYSIKNTGEKIRLDSHLRQTLKRVPNSERMELVEHIRSFSTINYDDMFSDHLYEPLQWNEVREMMDHNITIGAHTETHPILSMCDATLQQNEIRDSIQNIRKEIGVCELFAYPNGQAGDWNAQTIHVLKELSIACAWTTEGTRINLKKQSPQALPRVTIDAESTFDQFTMAASGNKEFIKSIIPL